MLSKAIPATAVLCALLVALALYAGLSSLRPAGPPVGVAEANRFHLQEGTRATYVIDQKTGRTWLFTAEGPKLMFEPSVTGDGWAVVSHSYPEAKPVDYSVIAPGGSR